MQYWGCGKLTVGALLEQGNENSDSARDTVLEASLTETPMR